MQFSVPAVVLGSCHHALSMCRSLGRKGVPTFIVHETRNMPVSKTRYAKSIYVSDINTEELINNLIEISKQFSEKPVLFPTNDNMVINIALNYKKIKGHYRLNWPDPEIILKMVHKKSLPEIIKKANLHYPKSYNLYGLNSLSGLKQKIQYPVILKPSRPRSPFKVKRIASERELINVIKEYENVIDCFILQELIPGSDRDIYFVNMYYNDQCKPIAHFTGRKIRANPKTLGAACSAEGIDNKKILDLAMQFFSTVQMRGPAALEFKKGPDGQFYVIEPTIGRTEFLLRTCIENGVDIPYIAYLHQIGVPTEYPRQRNNVIWVDFEKDLPMLIDSLMNPVERKEAINTMFKKWAFSYWAWDDPKPSVYKTIELLNRVRNKIYKVIGRGKKVLI